MDLPGENGGPLLKANRDEERPELTDGTEAEDLRYMYTYSPMLQ